MKEKKTGTPQRDVPVEVIIHYIVRDYQRMFEDYERIGRRLEIAERKAERYERKCRKYRARLAAKGK